MLILDSSTPVVSFSEPNVPRRNISSAVKKSLLYSSVFLGVGVLIVPAVFALSNSGQPTGTYLDPRPKNEMAMATPTPVAKDPGQLILSAQAFLEKAISLSSKTNQTPDDKQQIVALLNQSLDYSNQAVLSSPNSPQTYLIRARVLASSSNIRTDAVQLAQRDLEFAQKLSGGQPVDLPTQVNLLNLSPTQQASLAQNVIIAGPAETTAATTSATSTSNMAKSTAAIPAGETSITIKNPQITSDNYLYVVGSNGSHPIFIQTKGEGSAVIATTSISATPITFEYWLVKP